MQNNITDYLANLEFYVVHLDQQTGASHAAHWLKSSFSVFSCFLCPFLLKREQMG